MLNNTFYNGVIPRWQGIANIDEAINFWRKSAGHRDTDDSEWFFQMCADWLINFYHGVKSAVERLRYKGYEITLNPLALDSCSNAVFGFDGTHLYAMLNNTIHVMDSCVAAIDENSVMLINGEVYAVEIF